jgi:nucleotide-binding universal stress UspA family protein
MTTARTILAAVDFGDASASAVTVAGEIARRWPADVRLLHAEALEAPVYFTREQVEGLAAQRRALQARARSFLEEFGRRHTSTPFTAAVDLMSPTDAILARAAGADLVVMGTHGRRGPSRWWLGSVAERVMREIDRPLLVVHAGDDPEAIFRRVCVCAEAPARGDHAFALAAALAGPDANGVTDRRPGQVDAAPDATLLVVATPHGGDRTSRSRIGVARLRTDAGSVLFVPE